MSVDHAISKIRHGDTSSRVPFMVIILAHVFLNYTDEMYSYTEDAGCPLRRVFLSNSVPRMAKRDQN